MLLEIHLAVQFFAFWVFFGLTHHPDFRENRWQKIAWTAFLLFIFTEGFYGQIKQPFLFVASTLGVFGLLVLTWAGTIAQWAAHYQVGFFYRDIHSITGLKPDFKFAYNHRRDGEAEAAIKEAQVELEKDPMNFEGNLLLAQIYLDQNDPQAALESVKLLLNNPHLSESQRTIADAELANCKRLIDLQAIEAFNKRPNT